MIRATHYGKNNVSLYRTYAKPLTGLTPVPESSFTGRENVLFAADVDVRVYGENFNPAYTEGDNSMVVATDSMKNFVLRGALDYEGATQEGFLAFLGGRFLETYPQMERLRLRSRELPFEAATVPGQGGFTRSGLLFSPSGGDCGFAELLFGREGEGVTLTDHRCGRLGLKLVKVSGSAFAGFFRDAHTTLPERVDRPLYIFLDVFWRYRDVGDLLGEDLRRYVAAEQVRDVVRAVFHDFVSMSIQHLLHEMGGRLLMRFPQLAEVSFEAQNRLWDTAFVAEGDERRKVYWDPHPPYGQIGLTMTQGD